MISRLARPAAERADASSTSAVATHGAAPANALARLGDMHVEVSDPNPTVPHAGHLGIGTAPPTSQFGHVTASSLSAMTDTPHQQDRPTAPPTGHIGSVVACQPPDGPTRMPPNTDSLGIGVLSVSRCGQPTPGPARSVEALPRPGLLSKTIRDDHGDGGIVSEAEMTAAGTSMFSWRACDRSSDERHGTMASVRLYTEVVGKSAGGWRQPTRGLPSVMIDRTASGRRRASSMAWIPPRLHPTRLTLPLSCLAASSSSRPSVTRRPKPLFRPRPHP